MLDASEPKEKPASPARMSPVMRLLVVVQQLIARRLSPDEAQAVRRYVDAEGQLCERYVLMCALSAGIATLGLLQSSSAVVIGAMLVSPLMSPIAKLGFSFASLDARRAQNAGIVLAIGCGVGLVLGMALTWLSPIRNATPEIIARTAPTLLDLAIATLSGLAGGYATVHRRGETAIGVAIATALMPPLATIGYSIAVGRWDFAGGALLLFLTNLAAISFSFALVARLRGVARPLHRVEFKARHVIIGLLAFLVLVTPLGMSLRRLAREAAAANTARQEIARLLAIDPTQIAQLSVIWPMGDHPQVIATVITPTFAGEAETILRESLDSRLSADVDLRLQQIVASNPQEQTQAMIEAAIAEHRLAPALTAPNPPIEPARQAARFQTAQAWGDDQHHVVTLLAAPQADWSLGDFKAEEERLNALGLAWTVRVVPPYQERAPILFANNATQLTPETTAQIADIAWALQRWGVTAVRVEGVAGANTGATRSSRTLAQARADHVAAALAEHGVTATPARASRETARRLSADGVARTRSADILPFARP